MKNKIPSLNGLRAISIFMVIGYHFNQYRACPDSKVVKYVSALVFNGPLGVGVFFIVSGFLITTLLLNEENRFGSISLEGFYIRRIVRIFPAYYFLLSTYLLLQLLGWLQLDALDWLTSGTLMKQFYNSTNHETGHLWSLSVEEVFYLAWPLLFVKTRKMSVYVIASVIFLVVLTRMLMYKSPSIMNTVFSTGDALLVGCLFAIKQKELVAWIEKRKKLIYAVVGCLILSVLANKYLSFVLLNGPAAKPVLILASICYGLFGNIGLFTNLLIALVIVFSIVVTGNTWYRILNNSFVDHIGKLSYSIYLWQQLFISNKVFYELNFVFVLGLIYIAACCSYYLVEKPFLKLKDRIAPGRSAQVKKEKQVYAVEL
ncbi:acyltransferase family protein [Hymenobacter crusticola]|uniref:acyltransferase family protein n=1 Tax=Hymenobacter crusticola TaxID=1770526 RepID=UPI0015C50C13|nr:acyltransferase [Hymenobacter crusticola]